MTGNASPLKHFGRAIEYPSQGQHVGLGKLFGMWKKMPELEDTDIQFKLHKSTFIKYQGQVHAYDREYEIVLKG